MPYRPNRCPTVTEAEHFLDKASKASTLRPAVGYLRRSTDRQDQSIPDQRKALEDCAETGGYHILRFYTDDAISGASAENRPAFQRMVADASYGHCDFRAVLVYDVKRFGRVDSDEAGYYRHLLRKQGVEVVYTSEGFTGHETDEIVRTVKQLQARQESKDLSKVTLRGQLSRVHAGSYLGGVPPFGFDYLYLDSAGKPIHILRYNEKGHKLLLHPATADVIRVIPPGERLTRSNEDQIRLILSSPDRVAIIRRIFDEYLAGYGFRAIANRLNAEGIRSPRLREWDATKCHDTWCVSTIRNILINPVFMGDTCWNRRTQGKFHRLSAKGVVERHRHTCRVSEPNPREDWVLRRNTHEAIVPRSVFDAAQALRSRRDDAGWGCRSPRGRGKYSYYLFSGLITCGDCGHKIYGYTHKSRACSKDPSLPRPRYYLCGGYITKGTSVCKRKAYPQEPLETYILSMLLARVKVFLKKGGRKMMRQMLREAFAVAGSNAKGAVAEVQAEKGQLRNDVDRLLANLTPGNSDFVDEKLGEIRRRLQHLQAQEGEMQARGTQKLEVEAAVEAALAQVRLREVMARGSIVERKELLRSFIAGITITPSKNSGVITWYNLPASF